GRRLDTVFAQSWWRAYNRGLSWTTQRRANEVGAGRGGRKMNRHSHLARTLIYILLITLTLLMVIPALTVVIPIVLFSGQRLFDDPLGGGLWQAVVFTLARCAFYIGLALAVGLMGGYIFSKLRFRGRNNIFLLFLSGMIMPQILM